MAMDTYKVEYYTTDGKRMGMQFSAYCSQDVIKYVEQMPNFSMIASFPEKIANG